MNRTPSAVLLVALIVALAACNGSADGSGPVASPGSTSSAGQVGPSLSRAPSDPTSPSGLPSEGPGPGASVAPSAAASSGETVLVRAYFVLGGEPGTVGLLPVLRAVPKTATVATAAMDALLAGPTSVESGDRQITSAIPAGTKLLGLTTKGGVATVDLSTEFGTGGDASSLQYRLAQVVYTLTQFSSAKSVVVKVEGATVKGPVARTDYYAQLPAIFVDRPAYRAAVGNPARVTGNANVFEATFRVAILDSAGKSLVDQQVMASCGTGCRGTFDTTLTYVVTKAEYGTLRAYNLSAKDGTPGDVRDYSVWLTPPG